MTEHQMPAVVTDNGPLLTKFFETSKHHVEVLLSALSDAHGRKGSARYAAFHAADAPSNSSMTFHRYPQFSTATSGNVGHNKHTDAGTLTVLFAMQWGLQVPSASCKEGWEWVRQRLGYAI